MDFAERIAAMRPGYLTRTRERLEQLLGRLTDCPEGERREALGEARIVLHDVAGTAPVMGLAEAGSSARILEDQVLALLQSHIPLTHTCIAEARLAVARLCGELTG